MLGVRFGLTVISGSSLSIVECPLLAESRPWRLCRSYDRFCWDSGTNFRSELMGAEFRYRPGAQARFKPRFIDQGAECLTAPKQIAVMALGLPHRPLL